MFISFKIENDKEVIVDQTGAKDASYDSFKSALPADDCRYAVVEVPGTTKLVFIMWAPDSAPVKAKMIYASTRQGNVLFNLINSNSHDSYHLSLRTQNRFFCILYLISYLLCIKSHVALVLVISDKLSGHQKTVQASDLGDVDEAKIKKLVS